MRSVQYNLAKNKNKFSKNKTKNNNKKQKQQKTRLFHPLDSSIEVLHNSIKDALTPPTHDAYAKLDKIAMKLFLFLC